MIILGIDPGQKGGIALVDYDVSRVPCILDARTMPTIQVRAKKTVDKKCVDNFVEEDYADVGIIELVSSRPTDGGPAGFQFGRMFGAAEMILYEHSETQAYVTPTVWKMKMGLTSDKKASLDLATREFGQKAADEFWPAGPRGGLGSDGVAEAALLTLYYWRYLA